MNSTNSRDGRNRRRLLILLALLLAGGVYWYFNSKSHQPQPGTPSTASASGEYDLYHDCGMEGDARNRNVKALNLFKNRYMMPADADMDRSITLAKMLQSGEDHERFKMQQVAEIVGYVSDVKVGGIETCNCKTTDPLFRDTHIELVLDPMNGAATPVIVEVTPRWRAIMQKRGVDWSTRALRDAYLGRWVKVRGWMLFDAEHESQAVNTNPDNRSDWRQTAWELHPVTSIEVTTRPRQPVASR